MAETEGERESGAKSGSEARIPLKRIEFIRIDFFCCFSLLFHA